MGTEPRPLKLLPVNEIRRRDRYDLLEQPTALVDRERELKLLTRVLRDGETRLLTIVGPGGVGKTRLADEVARNLSSEFDSLRFIDMTGMNTADGLLEGIAESLGAEPASADGLLPAIRLAVNGRRVLLVLDNGEHLISAGPALAALLSHCSGVSILATSRQDFHIRWEHAYHLQPLPVPSQHPRTDVTELARVPAATLLIERIRAVQPEFELNHETAPLIAQICRDVDGLPLAIELAASQLRRLSLRSLSRRLAQPMQVLTSGAQDLPVRQQSMRNSIHASYVLLSPPEQAIARQLAVFGESAAVSDIEAVILPHLDTDAPLIEVLGSLADQSLIRLTEDADGMQTVRLLNLVRAYLLDQLRGCLESDQIYLRLITHWIEITRPLQHTHDLRARRAILDRVERNLATIQVLLDWSIASDQPEAGLELAISIWPFWESSGAFAEGLRWLGQLLDRLPTSAPTMLRTDARAAAGMLASRQGLLRHALPLLEQSWTEQAAAATTDDSIRLIGVLACTLLDAVKPQQAAEQLDQLLERLDGSVHPSAVGWRNLITGLIAAEEALPTNLPTVLDYSLGLFQEAADQHGMLRVTLVLGELHLALAAWDLARQHFNSLVALARRIDDQSMQTLALIGLADAALGSADWAEAARHYAQLLAGWPSRSDYRMLIHCLEGIGILAAHAQPTTNAGASWFAAVATLRQQTGYRRTRIRHAWLARFASSALLGTATSEIELNESEIDVLINHASTTLDNVLAQPEMSVQARQSGQALNTLSIRERDVAHCISRGLTNRQIALELGIAERTVDSHVGNVLRKLALSSRSQIAAWAVQHGLSPRNRPAS